MNFSQALERLKEGFYVSRIGWNGKGMYIALQQPDANSKMGNPYLYIKGTDNKFTPWLASQTDLLANDWEVAGGRNEPLKDPNVCPCKDEVAKNEFDLAKEIAFAFWGPLGKIGSDNKKIIAEVKQLRKDQDAIVNRIENLRNILLFNADARGAALQAKIRAKDAKMWLGVVLEEMGTHYPAEMADKAPKKSEDICPSCFAQTPNK